MKIRPRYLSRMLFFVFVFALVFVLFSFVFALVIVLFSKDQKPFKDGLGLLLRAEVERHPGQRGAPH